MLCMLPALMSYSLAPSSTMMSCTIHSPTDSLSQPSRTLVYIVCNPAPRGSPFKLSLGLCSKLPRPILSPLSQSSCVLVLGPLASGCLILWGGEVAALVRVGITQYSAIVFSTTLRASSCQSFTCKLPASCSFSCSSGLPHAILMYDSLKYGCRTLIGSINRRWKTTQITYRAREYKQACSQTCCNTLLSFEDRNWWHSYKERSHFAFQVIRISLKAGMAHHKVGWVS